MAVGTAVWAQGNWEGAGPSSRRTGVAVTEIHYHPAAREDGKNLEFIELYNSQPWTENVSGWRLAGDVEFTLPEGTQIPGLGYLVVAAAPTEPPGPVARIPPAAATAANKSERRYSSTPFGVPSACFSTLSVMADPTIEAMASAVPSLGPMVAWMA